MEIQISENRDMKLEDIIELYKAKNWRSAYGKTIEFYNKVGFVRAGETEPIMLAQGLHFGAPFPAYLQWVIPKQEFMVVKTKKQRLTYFLKRRERVIKLLKMTES